MSTQYASKEYVDETRSGLANTSVYVRQLESRIEQLERRMDAHLRAMDKMLHAMWLHRTIAGQRDIEELTDNFHAELRDI